MSNSAKWVAVAFCLGSAARARAETTFADIERTIRKADVRSIEQLLSLLPEDLRSRFALVFRGRGLQGATLENPRVILYSEGGQLALTFNGAPSERGFNALEAMEFDPSSARFRLHEVLFPGVERPAEFSSDTPANCLRCHGEPARPVWDSSPEWPGVYGEHYGGPLSKVEQDGLRRFLRAKAGHGRYSALTRAEFLSQPEPFLANPDKSYENGRPAHNAELSLLLAKDNFRAIAAELSANPELAAFGPALLATLDARCPPIEQLLPARVRTRFRRTLSQFTADTEQADQAQAALKELRMPAASQGQPRSESEELNSFRHLVEEGLGVSTYNWTLALEKGTYDFATPGHVATSLLRAELERVLETGDKRLRSALRQRSDGDRYCSLLLSESNDNLATLPAPQTKALPAEAAASPLTRCTSCHDGEVGSAIPFDREAALAGRLRDGGYPHGTLLKEILFRLLPEAGAARMPLGANLLPAEQGALAAYLEQLAR